MYRQIVEKKLAKLSFFHAEISMNSSKFAFSTGTNNKSESSDGFRPGGNHPRNIRRGECFSSQPSIIPSYLLDAILAAARGSIIRKSFRDGGNP